MLAHHGNLRDAGGACHALEANLTRLRPILEEFTTFAAETVTFNPEVAELERIAC